MIRHVVVFQWSDSAPSDLSDTLAERLSKLPSLVPEIRGYSCGADAGLREGNFDFAVVADFDDVEAWRVYMANDEHQAVIAELVTPNLGTRVVVQFER
jgi:Stress responsive A/B Barrel Domain